MSTQAVDQAANLIAEPNTSLPAVQNPMGSRNSQTSVPGSRPLSQMRNSGGSTDFLGFPAEASQSGAQPRHHLNDRSSNGLSHQNNFANPRMPPPNWNNPQHFPQNIPMYNNQVPLHHNQVPWYNNMGPYVPTSAQGSNSFRRPPFVSEPYAQMSQQFMTALNPTVGQVPGPPSSPTRSRPNSVQAARDPQTVPQVSRSVKSTDKRSANLRDMSSGSDKGTRPRHSHRAKHSDSSTDKRSHHKTKRSDDRKDKYPNRKSKSHRKHTTSESSTDSSSSVSSSSTESESSDNSTTSAATNIPRAGQGSRDVSGMLPNANRGRRDAVRLRDWGIKFGGRNNDTPMSFFLFQLETMAAAEGLTDERLISHLHIVLEGTPKEWYWCYLKKHPNTTWKKLRKELIRECGGKDDDDRIKNKIYEQARCP